MGSDMTTFMYSDFKVIQAMNSTLKVESVVSFKNISFYIFLNRYLIIL